QKLVERMKEEGSAQAKLAQAAQQIEQMQQALQAMTQQLQKAQQEAQQAALQKPLTPVDMVKIETERAKQGLTAAQTEHTRAQTGVLVNEAMTPPALPEALPAPTAMDQAKVELTLAQAGKTRTETAKIIHDVNNPPPPTKPIGNGSG